MFFSVKVPMRIGGKKFKTCICYTLTDYLKNTVKELEKQGKAVIYPEQRFFCNGKLVETKKEQRLAKKRAKKEAAEEKEQTEVTADKKETGF